MLRLEQAVRDVEPLLGALDRPGAREQILARLDPLNAPLVGLGAASNRESGDRFAQIRHDLMRLNHAFSLISAAVIICGCILLGLIIHQDRRLRHADAMLRELSGSGPGARPNLPAALFENNGASGAGKLACAD